MTRPEPMTAREEELLAAGEALAEAASREVAPRGAALDAAIVRWRAAAVARVVELVREFRTEGKGNPFSALIGAFPDIPEPCRKCGEASCECPPAPAALTALEVEAVLAPGHAERQRIAELEGRVARAEELLASARAQTEHFLREKEEMKRALAVAESGWQNEGEHAGRLSNENTQLRAAEAAAQSRVVELLLREASLAASEGDGGGSR